MNRRCVAQETDRACLGRGSGSLASHKAACEIKGFRSGSMSVPTVEIPSQCKRGCRRKDPWWEEALSFKKSTCPLLSQAATVIASISRT